ncbi:MAG: hypothetical protein HWN66_06590 [Candidatus Helarchaeota archaeon]|nr:hypothetical protein [Candidatus Helarchaeota archaeon]
MTEKKYNIEGLDKIKYPAKELGYEYKELPDGWWLETNFLLPREKEPTAFEALQDFMINKIVPSPTAVELAGHFVSRIVLLEVEHPKKDEYEYVRIMISPTDIAPGTPNAEADLLVHTNYYDLIRVLKGEPNFDIMTPLWAGAGYIIGNVTAGLDLKDIIDAAVEKERVPRPSIWPLGNP